MAAGGLILKGTSVFLRALQFLASIAVLGIFSFLLVYLRDHTLPTYTWVRAVEGISGASALYTLIALFLVCCIGGVMVFALVGIVLDIAFIGAWIAIAVLTRDGGTANCSVLDNVRVTADTNTLSDFNYGGQRVGDQAHRICVLEKSTFGIAIAAVVLFILSAIFQFALAKHHQKEKRKAPNTPVMAGQKKKFWQRKNKNKHSAAENGAYRHSQDTAMTGVTATEGTQYGHTDAAYGNGHQKYGQAVNY